MTVAWRAAGRPSEQFYAPAFPLAGPAAAQSYMDWATGTKAQFHATPEQVSYSPDRTIYTFLAMQNFLDWMPQDRAVFEKDRDAYEENAAKVVAAAKAKAQLIARLNLLLALIVKRLVNTCTPLTSLPLTTY